MYINRDIQTQSPLKAQNPQASENSSQVAPGNGQPVSGDATLPVTEQPPSAEVAAPISSDLVMLSCLTPFILAFLLFSVHMTRRAQKINRWVKQLQQVATLERALEKTPDECS